MNTSDPFLPLYHILHCFLGVLDYSGYCSKSMNGGGGGGLNDRNLFLTVTEKSKIELLADSGSGEHLLSGLKTATF